MSFQSPAEFHSSLPPPVFFEKLREATVPFDEIISLEKPLEGYLDYLKETFTGERTMIARIEGQEARLLPIGIWPVKGRSGMANCGYLSCIVDAEETGSMIRSSYQLAWIYKVAIPLFLLFSALLAMAIAGLILYGAELEGRWMLVGSAAFAILLCLAFPLYYLRAANTQSRLTREFLEKFVTENV